MCIILHLLKSGWKKWTMHFLFFVVAFKKSSSFNSLKIIRKKLRYIMGFSLVMNNCNREFLAKVSYYANLHSPYSPFHSPFQMMNQPSEGWIAKKSELKKGEWRMNHPSQGWTKKLNRLWWAILTRFILNFF